MFGSRQSRTTFPASWNLPSLIFMWKSHGFYTSPDTWGSLSRGIPLLRRNLPSFFYLYTELFLSGSSHLLQSHNHISRGHERHRHSTSLCSEHRCHCHGLDGLLELLQGSSKDLPLFSHTEDKLPHLVQCNHMSWKSVFLWHLLHVSVVTAMSLPSIRCPLHPPCMARCGVPRVYGMRL